MAGPEPGLILPDWPAPPAVRAAATTRTGGVSTGPWAGLNLGDHVGDDAAAVAANRARLTAALALPAPPSWLAQVHGRRMLELAPGQTATAPADGALARGAGVVCTVLTADCLPVLFCDRDGTRVAAVHAGWRGLAAGILAEAVQALGGPPADLLAWLGPAIGQPAYEVGDDVREAFTAPGDAAAFAPNARGRWQLDLAGLARQRLAAAGVTAVFGGHWCTHGEQRFFSHRRDGRCGRQAALIWLEPAAS